MKKILLACAAMASLAAAMPAAAQPWDGDYGNFERREARAERRIEWCQRNGGLSWREARELRNELRQLDWQQRRLRRGGVDRWEYNRMERELDRIERHIRRECNDDNGWRSGDRGGRRGRDWDRDGVPDRLER